jgi:hypothetical protein
MTNEASYSLETLYFSMLLFLGEATRGDLRRERGAISMRIWKVSAEPTIKKRLVQYTNRFFI